MSTLSSSLEIFEILFLFFILCFFLLLLQGNTLTHHSIPPPPYIPPKRPAPDTSTACGDYLGAYNKFIEQNVKKSVEAARDSCELDKNFDQQIKKNIEIFIKKSSYADVAKLDRSQPNSSRIQTDNLSKNERANVNHSSASTLPLCTNIKSIRPLYNKSLTQSQTPLMLSSSLKSLAAPLSLLATKSESPSIPSTPPILLNSTAKNMARVTTKKKFNTPINYNEQLLSNLVKREMISKYSTPSTTCATGTSFNNLQLLYPSHTKFEKIHQNAINPPETQAQSTIQYHGQSQRSKEFKPQQHELQQNCQQSQKKYDAEQLQKVPQNQQKYIINTTKRSTEPYSTNYPRSKIKAEQPQPSTAYKISSSQDKTLLSEKSAPISELNTSISQAFIYNQLINFKSNLLQNRLLGVSSEDN